MKITTFSVPIGALIGLFIALNVGPTPTAILIGTLIGGFLGGLAGLALKTRFSRDDNK